MHTKIFKVAVCVFIFLNFLLGFSGVSSIFLTLSFYAFVLLVSFWIIKRSKANVTTQTNLKLLAAVLIISLLGSEFILRYVAKKNLTYAEKNGRFFYNSMYKKVMWENLKRKYSFKQNDIQVVTNQAHLKLTDTKPEFSYAHHYNSLGLRDTEPVADTGLFTIIGLGDSFTEGVGTAADSTWLKLLEHRLQQAGLADIQTINAGVNGSDPFSEYIVLERKLLTYHPDVVTVCINNSDIADVMVRGGFERFTDGTIRYNKAPWWEFFYSFSYLFRGLVHSLTDINYLLLTSEQDRAARADALSKIKECITTDYKNLAAQHGFKLVVVLHPLLDELQNNKFLLDGLARQLQQDTSILTIDLFIDYTLMQKHGQVDPAKLYWPVDMHHNSKGYALWAAILEKALLNSHIVKRGTEQVNSVQ